MNDRKTAIMFANMRGGRAGSSFFPALRCLSAAGIDVKSVHFNLDKDRISQAVDDARGQGVSLVLTFGGDGTIGSVVDAVVGKDVTLGFIPGGTSNNFVRSLGITCTIPASVDVIVRGTEEHIDIGMVNGHYFAHAAIMGLNVEFARQAQKLRPRVGRLSYPIASLIVYRSRRRLRVRITNEAQSYDLSTYQVALLNSNEFGGVLNLKVSHADISLPSLSVLVLSDLRLRTILKGLPRIFFQRHLGPPGSWGLTLKEGRVETENPTPMTLDGEIKTETPAEVTIVPHAIRVMKPCKESAK